MSKYRPQFLISWYASQRHLHATHSPRNEEVLLRGIQNSLMKSLAGFLTHSFPNTISTQSYWAFGHLTIVWNYKTGEHNVSESGSVSILRWEKGQVSETLFSSF
jgi:hypothetical protein